MVENLKARSEQMKKDQPEELPEEKNIVDILENRFEKLLNKIKNIENSTKILLGDIENIEDKIKKLLHQVKNMVLFYTKKF